MMDDDEGRWMMMMMMMEQKKVEQVKIYFFIGDHLGTIGGLRMAFQKFDSNEIYEKIVNEIVCGNLMVWLRIDSY